MNPSQITFTTSIQNYTLLKTHLYDPLTRCLWRKYIYNIMGLIDSCHHTITVWRELFWKSFIRIKFYLFPFPLSMIGWRCVFFQPTQDYSLIPYGLGLFLMYDLERHLDLHLIVISSKELTPHGVAMSTLLWLKWSNNNLLWQRGSLFESSEYLL